MLSSIWGKAEVLPFLFGLVAHDYTLALEREPPFSESRGLRDIVSTQC
jgi:hypothetical protein